MNIAIGLYVKNIHRELGDTNLRQFSNTAFVLDLPINHHCYSGDDDRDERGFKLKEDFFLRGTNILAITKRFEENEVTEVENGRTKQVIVLTTFFDYYGWPYIDQEGNNQQDLTITKQSETKYEFGSKSLNTKRIEERESSIDDMRSLGAKFEGLSSIIPHLVGYEQRMQRIDAFFQLEIGRFISTGSNDFKNAIVDTLNGEDEVIKADLNTLVPFGEDEQGGIIFVATHEGITRRL